MPRELRNARLTCETESNVVSVGMWKSLISLSFEMIDMIFHRSGCLLDKGMEIGFSFGVFEVGDDPEFIREVVPDVICGLELIDFDKFSVIESVKKCFSSLCMAIVLVCVFLSSAIASEERFEAFD